MTIILSCWGQLNGKVWEVPYICHLPLKNVTIIRNKDAVVLYLVLQGSFSIALASVYTLMGFFLSRD